jgi:hypothetical protein
MSVGSYFKIFKFTKNKSHISNIQECLKGIRQLVINLIDPKKPKILWTVVLIWDEKKIKIFSLKDYGKRQFIAGISGL